MTPPPSPIITHTHTHTHTHRGVKRECMYTICTCIHEYEKYIREEEMARKIEEHRLQLNKEGVEES